MNTMNTRIAALLTCTTLFTACGVDDASNDDDEDITDIYADDDEVPVTGRTVIMGAKGPFVATYSVLGDRAIVDGDIDIGPVDELTEFDDETLDTVAAGKLPGARAFSPIPVWGNRWASGVVFYKIDPDASDATRNTIIAAVQDFDSKTQLTFVRDNTPPTDHIYFTWSFDVSGGGGVSDSVGRKGGRQYIRFSLDSFVDGVNYGTVQHEVGHAIGLYHEHQRADRDSYVTVIWPCIQPGKEGNFEIRTGVNYTSYDVRSLMHYRSSSARLNANCKTLVTKSGGTITDAMNSLTQNDIAGINAIY